MNVFTAHLTLSFKLPRQMPVYAVSTSFNGIQRSFRFPIDPCTREVTFLDFLSVKHEHDKAIRIDGYKRLKWSKFPTFI